MQDSDIEDIIDSHVGYSAKIAFSYHISKHSASSYGSLVDTGANGGLAGQVSVFWKELGEKYLSLALITMNYQA